MHSLLLANLVRSALGSEQIRFPVGPFQKVIERIAEMVRELGCPDAEIIKGGDSAVEFWSAWWAAAY